MYQGRDLNTPAARFLWLFTHALRLVNDLPHALDRSDPSGYGKAGW